MNVLQNKTGNWFIPVLNQSKVTNHFISIERNFQFPHDLSTAKGIDLSIKMETNLTDSFSLEMTYIQFPVDKQQGALFAGLILIFLNVLIVSEVRKIFDQTH